MTDEQKKSLQEKISEAISSGKITVRPRWHFMLRGILLLVGAALLGLVLLFVVSLIFFSLRRSGAWFGPGFGGRGVWELLQSLPWLLIGLSIIFIVVLEILVRHYSIAYRKPMLYSAMAVLALAITGGFVVALTPLHGQLFQQARQHRLPFGEGFYRGLPRPGHILTGEITDRQEPNFHILTDRDENILVVVGPNTKCVGCAFTDLETGDSVVVFGQRDDDQIAADAIREVTTDPSFPPRPMMGGRGMMR